MMMEKNNLRRISFSSSSSSTLANFKLKKNYQQENKKWEWLDLSDSTQRFYSDPNIYNERHAENFGKDHHREAEDDDNKSFIKNWSTTSIYNNNNNTNNNNRKGLLNVEQQDRVPHRSTNPSGYRALQQDLNLSSDFSNDFVYQDFDDFRFPSGDDVVNFYQTGKRSSSFEYHTPRSSSRLPASPANRFTGSASVLEQKPPKSTKIHHRTSNTAFTSSNIYLRPLPANFTPLDLHELCMSMVRSSNPQNHKKFHILSVKVMIEEEDKSALGTCKGFGFCLWNSVQASTACIEGLRAHGYQASFARESSRAMLSSLADPTSANIYLSNLPQHWGEDELKELFGDTPIASARLLRDRDDEAVGSGASRGVGFVRLGCRSDALHFVELLHGMPIPGTNCHLQCRMADSQAQKEWKRNIRSTFKQPSTSIESSPQKHQSPASTSSPNSKKWLLKKSTHQAHANMNVVTPDRRGSVVKSSHRNMTPSYSEPVLEGMRGGGFHVVGLGSPGGPMLMPPFHTPSPLPGHGPMISATNNRLSPAVMAPTGNEIQRIFPITPAFFPVYPPTWYPQQACPGLNFSPGSNYSSMNTSPYPQSWSSGTFDPQSPTPSNLAQKSFGNYYHDSSLTTPLPQNDHLNEFEDTHTNRNLDLNLIDQTSSDRVHSSLTQPMNPSSSIQEFYSTDSSMKILDQSVRSKINPNEKNLEEKKKVFNET